MTGVSATYLGLDPGFLTGHIVSAVNQPDLLVADIEKGADVVVGKLKGHHDTGPSPTVTSVDFTDPNGVVIFSISGLSILLSDFENGLHLGLPDEGNQDNSYPYLVSLFDGAVTVSGSGQDDIYLEVGAGESADVDGNAGNDKLYVWHQKTIDFDGGAGVDTLAFDYQYGFQANSLTSGAVVDLANHTGTNPFGGTLTLHNVENVVGDFNHDNDLRGDDAANLLVGGTAVDQLRGAGGNDTIYVKYSTVSGVRAMLADGGQGLDQLTAELSDGSAAPFIGTGPNTLFINILDLLDPSQDTGTFHGGSFVNFETFRASGYAYHRFDFRGSNAGETAIGALGPDFLNGRGGNDVLSSDFGDDILTGGIGRDRLTGGAGLDKFDFNAVGESTVGANHDTIVDFSRANHDRIDLTTIDADQRPGHAGNQSFIFIGADTFVHYHSLHPSAFAMVRSAGGLVQANVNASLAADFEIKLNLLALLHGDFLL